MIRTAKVYAIFLTSFMLFFHEPTLSINPAAAQSEYEHDVAAAHPGYPSPWYFGKPDCATPVVQKEKICVPSGQIVDLRRSTIREVSREGLPIPSKLNSDPTNPACLIATVAALPDHSGAPPYYRCLSYGSVITRVVLRILRPGTLLQRRR
jgi:hypothetical protein